MGDGRFIVAQCQIQAALVNQAADLVGRLLDAGVADVFGPFLHHEFIQRQTMRARFFFTQFGVKFGGLFHVAVVVEQ